MRTALPGIVTLALVLSLATIACKKPAPPDAKPSASAAASTPPYTLKGEYFEVLLPAGWRAHPKKDMRDPGSVNPAGPYELIIATHMIDLEKTADEHMSFDEAMKQLADLRRNAALDYSTPADVEAIRQRDVNGRPALVFRGHASQAPLAGANVFCALIGLKSSHGNPMQRPILTVSLYDYRGGSLDRTEELARELLKPLDILE